MLKRFMTSREALLVAAIALLLILISSRFPGFITPANLANVFNDTSPLILLAIGQMIVILTKCIDLSVAANLALTGMVVSMVNVAAPGLPIVVILAIAIGLGTLLGMFNGSICINRTSCSEMNRSIKINQTFLNSMGKLVSISEWDFVCYRPGIGMSINMYNGNFSEFFIQGTHLRQAHRTVTPNG